MSLPFLLQYWRDEFLIWNPESYGNVTNIHLPSSSIWRPDIAIYNRSVSDI